MNEYITTKEAADKWGLSERRVRILCSEQRVKGVVQVGRAWLIPKDAPKPEDARSAKESPDKTKRESAKKGVAGTDAKPKKKGAQEKIVCEEPEKAEKDAEGYVTYRCQSKPLEVHLL